MHEANQKNPSTRKESKRSVLIIRRAVKKMPRSCHVILAEPCITSIAQLCLAEIKPSNEKDEIINASSFAHQVASRSQEDVQNKNSITREEATKRAETCTSERNQKQSIQTAGEKCNAHKHMRSCSTRKKKTNWVLR